MGSDVAELGEGLTEDLKRVARWVKILSLNVKKTKLLLTSSKRRSQELEHVQVKVDDQELLRSKKVKCLGVMLDDGLTWQEQVGGSVFVVWQN